MKLASLLQTNIKKGTSQLRVLLEHEVNESFEKRKNIAKIKGEEATNKAVISDAFNAWSCNGNNYDSSGYEI